MTEISHEDSLHTYFISDTHFDHSNIIKYCDRPFSTVEYMNNTILHNWNNTIKDNDTVYFLGDLTHRKNSRNSTWWIHQLRGKIIWLKGNHDKLQALETVNVEKIGYSEIVRCDGYEFLLVHRGVEAPTDIWIIHGHNHNNRPHIEPEIRWINVSVEVIQYTPISLAEIIIELKIDEDIKKEAIKL